MPVSLVVATAELTHKLAVGGVVWEGARHKVHQAGVPAGAAWWRAAPWSLSGAYAMSLH